MNLKAGMLKISKSEWLDAGRRAGFIRKAQESRGSFVDRLIDDVDANPLRIECMFEKVDDGVIELNRISYDNSVEIGYTGDDCSGQVGMEFKDVPLRVDMSDPDGIVSVTGIASVDFSVSSCVAGKVVIDISDVRLTHDLKAESSIAATKAAAEYR